MEKISGVVSHLQAISRTEVAIELNSEKQNKVVRLVVGEPWVISQGDSLELSGEADLKSGVFVAYAYTNQTKGVRFYPEYTIGMRAVAAFWYLLSGFFVVGTASLLYINLFDSRPRYLTAAIVFLPFLFSCFLLLLGYKRFAKLKRITRAVAASE